MKHQGNPTNTEITCWNIVYNQHINIFRPPKCTFTIYVRQIWYDTTSVQYVCYSPLIPAFDIGLTTDEEVKMNSILHLHSCDFS